MRSPHREATQLLSGVCVRRACKRRAAWFAFVACACSSDPDQAARLAACLVGATERPAFLALSEEEANAVVAVRRIHPETGEVEQFCSGVVVGETSVLTAAHCAFPSMEVVVGSSVACPQVVVAARLRERHVDVDVAVLEAEALAAVPDIEPISWVEAEVQASLPGRPVQLAGFGTDLRAPPEARRFVVQSVVALSSETVTVDGMGRSGACVGDSGGPLLIRGTRGTPVLLGLLSEGSESCTGRDVFVRLDRISEWLTARVDRVPSRKLCGGVDSRGACFGTVAVRCTNGEVVGEECAEPTVCAWSAAREIYTCLEAPDSACDFVDQLGECDSGRARVCIHGELLGDDCDASGMLCRRSRESGIAVCEDR